MKKVTPILIFLALSFSVLAQPTAITWQGKLLDNSGNAITQDNVAMTFAMFDASTSGTQLWPASGVVTKTVNVVNGLYSVQMGTGTGDDIAFTAAMFDGKSPWLEVKIGTEILPRTEISNVPFALISNNLSASGWKNPGQIGQTTPNTGKFTSVETGSVKITTGAGDGKVLSSDATGNAGWITLSASGLTNFAESNYTYNTKTGVKWLAANDAANVDLVVSPKGTGAVLARQPDGTTDGGNNRGNNAVDLQTVRSQITHVASGTASVIMGGSSNEASGNYSIASGTGSTASGIAATAFGQGGTAMGNYSFSAGLDNSASGIGAVGLGYKNSAHANYTFVAGNSNIAQSESEAVLGMFSKSHSIANNNTDPIFAIGNGTSSFDRSDALIVLKNANTTVGGSLTINGNGTNTSITFPTARGTSGQVLSSDGSGATSWYTPISGLANFSEANFTYNAKTGVKLAPDNAATNVDFVVQPKGTGSILARQPDGTTDGGNNRGNNAVDLQTVRSQITHVASGTASVIMGGSSNEASGNYSIASGTGTTASGIAATAFGQGGTAMGNYSFAAGLDISASGIGAVGLGYKNSAHANYTFVAGNSNIAQSESEAVLGMFSKSHSIANNNTDPIFAIGNGTSSFDRSDALLVLKNANTTIGGSLTLNGNVSGTSYVFPIDRGTNGQVLTTGGSGGTSWSTPNAGTVTSVTGTAPISVATGTSTPVISIAEATTSTAGSMSATDKTKLDGIPTLSIGQSYEGGIIFWLDATGQHGLIAATADQSTGVQWYNGTYRYTGTTGDGLYAGAMNTTMIITTQMADNQTGNFAAKVCADYTVTVSGVTYGDWYLPSKYELNLLYAQKTAVGGFTSVYYWSSTESSNGLAWGHDFDSGGPSTNQKNVTDKVRAVRAF